MAIGLTSVIGREPVLSAWYGRRHHLTLCMSFMCTTYMYLAYRICCRVVYSDASDMGLWWVYSRA